MARGERLGASIRKRLSAAVRGHGFTPRGAVWIRQTPGSRGQRSEGGRDGRPEPAHGRIEAIVRLEIEPRGDEWLADAVVGVRSDAIERTLAELRGQRAPRRRETPSWYRRLSRLHGSAPEIRPPYQAWRFTPAGDTEAALEDFESALTFSAMPVIESASRLDGLLTQMEGGRIDGDVAWRLPVLHFLRGDATRAREALEQATRWARRSETIDADEYRAFALAIVRRLGDAALEETPCEEIVSVLRPALRAAFPDRAGAILAQLVRSFWWEKHPTSAETEHCSFCGTTGAEAVLFGGDRGHRICDTCVSACGVLVDDASLPGAREPEMPDDRPPPSVQEKKAVPTAASLAADAVRALRATGSESAVGLVAEVERRLLTAPADRPAEDVCLACGPILPPVRRRMERGCSFRGTPHESGERLVDAGRGSICDSCVRRFLGSVREERRLD